MKTMILTSILAVSLVTLISCNSKSLGGTGAIGVPYEIAVVMDQTAWEDSAGYVLKKELTIDILGLPQLEPTMRPTYVSPVNFDGMMRYIRNILIVDFDESKYTKVSFRSESDKWANGQIVGYLTSPSKALLIEYLEENRRLLAEFYTGIEMERMGNIYRGEYSHTVMEKVKNRFDIRIYAPTEFTYFKDTTNFFWTSNHANKGRMDLVIYAFPYTDPNTFTLDYLVAVRDSVLGANIPGSHPNSYMSTNKLLTDYTPIALNGKYCGVLRGLWHMEGDMMGGPYVSIARLDEANNRVVVAEGFVYAPESDKRNYIRRLEASLYTLLLPNETASKEAMPLAQAVKTE